MLYFVSSVLFLIFAYLTYHKYNSMINFWKNKKVPFIRPDLIFGNYKDIFLSGGSMKSFLDMYYYYENEKLVGIFRAHTPELLIRDPDLVREIFVKDFNHFMDNNLEEHNEVLLKNLLTYQGKEWKIARQKLSPAFTPNKLKQMFELIKEKSLELSTVIRETELNNDAVNIPELISKYVVDVIGSVGFGIKMNSMLDDNEDFRKITKKLFSSNIWMYIKYAVKLSIPTLAGKFGIKLISDDIQKFFTGIIKNIVDQRKEFQIKRQDFIDTLIDIKEKYDLQKPEDRDDLIIDLDFMTAQAFLFFIAGLETSSSMLSFTLHELAYNPDIQTKLYQEIKDILEKTNGEITYQSIEEMSYLDMVVKESLRKYPIVHTHTRRCTKPYTIPGTDIHIEKDVLVSTPIYAIHMDPKYYTEPNKFIPERFLPENRTKRNPMLYSPFSVGPRKCLGYKVGNLQGKLCLISILHNFEVKPSHKSSSELDIISSPLIQKSKNGIWLKFTERKI